VISPVSLVACSSGPRALGGHRQRRVRTSSQLRVVQGLRRGRSCERPSRPPERRLEAPVPQAIAFIPPSRAPSG
jgi:hypothetical protein